VTGVIDGYLTASWVRHKEKCVWKLRSYRGRIEINEKLRSVKYPVKSRIRSSHKASENNNKIQKKKRKRPKKTHTRTKAYNTIFALTFPRMILSLEERSSSSEVGIVAKQFFHPLPVQCSAIPSLYSAEPLPLPLLNVVFLTFSALLPTLQVIMRGRG
jgi:hypothetical protein